MTVSVIVHTADPEEKGYPFREALDSYLGLADEVILVNGGKPLKGLSKAVKVVDMPDPEVWDWSEHPKRLNKALELATSHWIIKMDIDWVLDEKTFDELKRKLREANNKGFVVASMEKYSVYPVGKYIHKSSVPVCISGGYKHRVRFGVDFKEKSDLVWPIFDSGKVDSKGVPIGELVPEKARFKTGVPYWNFDCTFKTIEQAKKQFFKGSLSYKNYFGQTEWGEEIEESWEIFLEYMKKNMRNAKLELTEDMLPKYIHYKYKRMTPDMFGYMGWGLV